MKQKTISMKRLEKFLTDYAISITIPKGKDVYQLLNVVGGYLKYVGEHKNDEI